MTDVEYDRRRQKCFQTMAPYCVRELQAVADKLESESEKASAWCRDLVGCSDEFLDEYLNHAAVAEIYREAYEAIKGVIRQAKEDAENDTYTSG